MVWQGSCTSMGMLKLAQLLHLYALTLIIGWSAASLAKPLDDLVVHQAKRIVVMPGSFDPFTKGHLAVAESAINLNFADIVIILPTSAPIHKEVLPYDLRVQLIEDTIAEMPNLYVPSSHTWRDLAKAGSSTSTEFYKALRHSNPLAELSVLVGQDVAEKIYSHVLLATRPDQILVVLREKEEIKLSPLIDRKKIKILPKKTDFSSTQVRTLLANYPQIYFEDSPGEEVTSARQALKTLMHPEAVNRIVSQGLYLGRSKDNKVSFFGKVYQGLAQRMTDQLLKWGLYDKFKEIAISLLAQKNSAEIKALPNRFQITRYLGSGLSNDVFVIQIEGQKYVLKVARNKKARETILGTIPVHQWAQRFGINTPQIQEFDAEGAWMVTEFIEGVSLKEYAQKQALSNPLRKEFATIQGLVQQMAEESNIVLDFAPDNLIVKKDKIYLVDLGPVPGVHKTQIYDNKAWSILLNTPKQNPLVQKNAGLLCSDIF